MSKRDSIHVFPSDTESTTTKKESDGGRNNSVHMFPAETPDTPDVKMKLIPSAPPLPSKKKTTFASAMKDVFTLVYPEKATLAISLSALALCSAINLAIPTLLAKAVDRMIRSRKKSERSQGRKEMSNRSFGIMCFGVVCVGSFASFVRTYTLGIANRNIAMKLRKKLFSQSLRKERQSSFVDNDQSVASVSMLSTQTDQIATVATNTCANLLRGLSSVIGGTYMRASRSLRNTLNSRHTHTCTKLQFFEYLLNSLLPQ